MMLTFRPTQVENLKKIKSFEDANAIWICPYSSEEHESCIEDSTVCHMSIWDAELQEIIGFFILKGLNNPNRALEFRRIVIGKKGRGYGRQSIRWIKHYCFETLGFHRLWLDVFTDNQRAQHLYESEGFVREGTLRDVILQKDTYRSLYLLSILEAEYFMQK